MRNEVRSILDAATRVVAFSREHPDSNPISQPLVDTLSGLVTRANERLEQFRGGSTGAEAAVVERHRVELEIRERLEHLSRIAAAAALRQPELAIRLGIPGKDLTLKGFPASVRRTIAVVQANQELMETYGMPETFPAEVLAQVERFVQLVDEKVVAQQSHVGANADLLRIAREALGAINHLDALNRLRFAGDAEMLASWKSAREVVRIKAKVRVKVQGKAA